MVSTDMTTISGQTGKPEQGTQTGTEREPSAGRLRQGQRGSHQRGDSDREGAVSGETHVEAVGAAGVVEQRSAEEQVASDVIEQEALPVLQVGCDLVTHHVVWGLHHGQVRIRIRRK